MASHLRLRGGDCKDININVNASLLEALPSAAWSQNVHQTQMCFDGCSSAPEAKMWKHTGSALLQLPDRVLGPKVLVPALISSHHVSTDFSTICTLAYARRQKRANECAMGA